jgi:hypothetical protein
LWIVSKRLRFHITIIQEITSMILNGKAACSLRVMILAFEKFASTAYDISTQDQPAGVCPK